MQTCLEPFLLMLLVIVVLAVVILMLEVPEVVMVVVVRWTDVVMVKVVCAGNMSQ